MLRLMASLGHRKLHYVKPAAGQKTAPHFLVLLGELFGASLSLQSALELPFGPATGQVIASCYTIHLLPLTMQTEKWFAIVQNKRVTVESADFFSFRSAHGGIYLWHFSTFSMCLKC